MFGRPLRLSAGPPGAERDLRTETLIRQLPLPTEPAILYSLEEPGGAPLDRAGMRRLFRIEDRWGWDLFDRVRFCEGLTDSPLPSATVEVDLQSGLFRTGQLIRDPTVTVNQALELSEQLAIFEADITAALPIGRSSSFRYLNTAPYRGRDEQ